MAFVYLITEENNENAYKIGSTRSNDIHKRMKQLQTGNSERLFLQNYFETDKPFKLEKMLHNRFESYRLNGEWFELNKCDVEAFKSICEHYQTIISSLNDNPFFNEQKNSSKKT